MRLSTVTYCLKNGLVNIFRNIWYSLASTATIAACIFLFCLLYSVVSNIQYIIYQVETDVGITVLFDEGTDEADILSMAAVLDTRGEVKELRYISAEEAWESFKNEYFEGYEELAEGFEDDNPLANSASLEIFLNDIDSQNAFVKELEGMDHVRRVNYSNAAVEGFSSFNRVVSLLSLIIICVLLAVSVFLISNTISVAAALRRQETQIMRLIGATNAMIRAPFLVEGIVIGLVGAVIPLAISYVLYIQCTAFLMERFRLLAGALEFLPISVIFPQMVAVGLILGVGIGFVGSFFTIRRYLKV